MNDIKKVKRRIAELREKHHLDPNDESIINSLIGARMRFVRLLRGKTQTKVANAIGVTFQQIQKYEKGSNGISTPKLMKTSKYLKFSFKWMFSVFKHKEVEDESKVNK